MNTEFKTDELAVDFAGESPEELVLVFKGALTGNNLAGLWPGIMDSVLKQSKPGVVADVSGATEIDGSGIALLAKIKAAQIENGHGFEARNMEEGLLKLLNSIDPEDMESCAGGRLKPMCTMECVGRHGVWLWQDLRALMGFVGECALSLLYALFHPGSVRLKNVSLCAEKVGADGVPIICLIGTLMGLIMAFQSVITLQRFGAEMLTSKFLGLSMVRELGPLVTAIILAGRSGAAFAAELGTMKVNDEINALITMGISPIRFLVVDRVVAAALMTPLLSLFFIAMSFVGGAFVMLPLGYPCSVYVDGLFSSVTASDFIGSMVKAVVFSMLIAGIGCFRGLRTGTGASAVGDSTTSAVVSGLVLITVADGLFAVIYYVLGI